MKVEHGVILNIILVSLFIQTLDALKCYNCHFAYTVKKDDKEFTPEYFNKDNKDSILNDDCGANKPPNSLMINCPGSKNNFCWMGVYQSDDIKGIARGCYQRSAEEMKRMKAENATCGTPIKGKTANGNSKTLTECFCNTGDGCSDWKFPGQKSGESMKSMLGGWAIGIHSGGQYTWFIALTAITIFSSYVLPHP